MVGIGTRRQQPFPTALGVTVTPALAVTVYRTGSSQTLRSL